MTPRIQTMKVTKRNGKLEELSFDKILRRLKLLCKEHKALTRIDPFIITQKTIQNIYDKISTEEIDELSAQIAITHITEDLEYGILASRIVVSNNQKNNSKLFSECVKRLKEYNNNLIADDIYEFILEHKDFLDNLIDNKRDYNYDYFGFKTLERSYFAKINSKTSETPQYMILRVSVGVHYDKNTDKQEMLDKIKETYELMSNGLFTHATPTLFNAGSKRPQMASCFLLSTEDSATGIYKTISDCAIISKWSGGIGVSIQDIRSKGSPIKGTNGTSDGIVPMLRVYNATARYMNQGSKRNGSFACYIEPWVGDIFEFLDMKKNTGSEETRARDLFYALWIPDLFMECVEKDSDWYLMCPSVSEGLTEAYGEKFNDLYKKYIDEGKYMRKVKAREVWNKILESQMETGTPYLLYKDACNIKSNQKNLGTIKNSNLCVSGETKILTSEGYTEIKSLENKEVEVWNGEEFSKTKVIKTGENQKLIKIEFDNGEELECTDYHKFYIETGTRPSDKSVEKEIRAKDLKKGMKIIKTSYPIIDNKTQQEFINDESVVPVNHCLDDKIRWLEETCDIIGCIETESVQIISPNLFFLRDIRLMLNTMGCDCEIIPDKTKECFRLCISTSNLENLISLGFSPKRLSLCDFKKGNRNASRFIKVKNVIHKYKYGDTFCFNEEKRHKGVFNGIITGQCSEIVQYSSPEETATCNLSSIALPKFVKEGKYDFEELKNVAYKIVYNMNKVIDHTFYPTPETRRSNMRHRPIGIGVQGLADVFFIMKLPFESEEARKLNKDIFEAIYYGTTRASCDIAKKDGAYETFEGSPFSEGKFQFDLWGMSDIIKDSIWDWESLRNDIKQYGIRNSLLTTVMPTASTSQILGNTEACEAIQSNIFSRTTLSGEFVVINKYLVKDLQELKLWNNDIKNKIIADEGSIQDIPEIPDNIKKLYKTTWEISQKCMIDMSADRAPFIDQSQSLNLFIDKPTIGKLTSMHFYAFKKGLKTGCYYLRTKPARNAVQFTIDPKLKEQKSLEAISCSINNKEACESCSA